MHPCRFRWEYLPIKAGFMTGPSHTETSERLSQAMNRGPIRKFLPNYANVYVSIQSHGLSAGVQTHYVTDNGVRTGLTDHGTCHQVEAHSARRSLSTPTSNQ